MVIVLSTSSDLKVNKTLAVKDTNISDSPKSLKDLEEKEQTNEQTKQEIVKEITPEKVVSGISNT